MAEPRRAARADDGDLKGARMLVVEARFYEDIADALLAGATRALEAAGCTFDRVTVPGAVFEIVAMDGRRVGAARLLQRSVPA